MNEFKTGDRVRCIESYGEGAIPGDTGVVVKIDFRTALVRWDDHRSCRHDCGGLCDYHHGWNVPINYIDYDACKDDFGELPALDLSVIL